MFIIDKVRIFSYIISFFINLRSQHKADRTRREIIKFTPYTRHNEQSLIWSIQYERALHGPIIQNNTETATGRHHQLIQFFMRMSSACLPARYIIQIVHTLHIKRNRYSVLNNRNVPFFMMMLVQLHHSTVIYRITFHYEMI
ncbi:MAG: hypothetical protein BHV63_06960 [Alistipes sp. 56_11]|nr:MAG: hypothetical protein BHV63_06960 [Alistipes sp. 56_11]